jgi:hypothetical protein
MHSHLFYGSHVFSVGSKFVLKLKRNISSAGFDTFHVLIERRPSTAPNSPQTPAKIGVTESSAPSSSSAIKDSCGPNKIGLQTGPASPRPLISAPDAASQSPYGSESKRRALTHEPSASSLDATVISMQSLIMPSTTHNADAAAVQTVASVQVTQISLSESVRLCSSDSRTHADILAQDHPDDDSVGARIPDIQVPLDPNVEILGVSDQRAPLQAACHRKLQFGADAHESPPAALSPPITRDCSTANEDGSSSSKPPFASPSASEFVEFEEAAVAAAAAHEHQRVANWVSLQAREISETDLPLTAENHEALQQRLQEQKLWGMVNSTILSDLMQSLGAKSIFYP